MQTQLSDESPTTNILRKPEHILSFIKHALATYTVPGTSSTLDKAKHSRGLGLEDLKIVDKEEDFVDSDGDDEPAEMSNDQAENNMTWTAINLLLAILEGMKICMYVRIEYDYIYSQPRIICTGCPGSQ